MSPSPNLALKTENVPLKQSTFIHLSTNIASGIVKIIPIKPSKKAS